MTIKKKKEEDFDFEAYQKQVVSGLMQGKGLLGYTMECSLRMKRDTKICRMHTS